MHNSNMAFHNTLITTMTTIIISTPNDIKRKQ